MDLINNLFKIKENNTSVRTELTAGITTFFTMSYLFVLSPKLLEYAGMDFGSSITVTAITTFICSVLMAFIANKPFAVAPFLGETAFISYTAVNAMGFSIKTVFACIFICGLLLLLITLFNIRTYLVNKIPQSIKLAFCAGLGLFFIFISLKDIGIVNFTQNTVPLETGNYASSNIILGLFCFILIITLVKKQIKAAIIIALAVTTLVGIIIKDVSLPSSLISMPYTINSSVMQIDFSSILKTNFIPLFFVLFILVNIDTAGAIVGLSVNSKLLNKDGSIPNMKKTMISDSLAVILAPVLGTTTPGAYLDSITGISVGGRTGLCALTVGCLFLLGLLFTPVIMIIPPYAYAPALLYVGILMTSALKQIDFEDISESAPVIFTISAMIFTYNIGIGIMTGFLIYPIIKLLCGKKEQTNPIVWTLFVISIIFFLIYPY